VTQLADLLWGRLPMAEDRIGAPGL
jgi:hypothetical protein